MFKVSIIGYRQQRKGGLLKSTAQSPVQFTEDCGTIGERISRKERERERGVVSPSPGYKI